MISAKDARQLQYNNKLQEAHAQIEFDAKHTYLDEYGTKQYYSIESFDDIMNNIEDCCKYSYETAIVVRNRLHPDTVRRLKGNGYRVFLNRYETHDIRPSMNKYGKRIYEPITYRWIDTHISWGGNPKGIGKFEEI